MKPVEIVVLSGKGGTGKTSITASFAALADAPVLVDCDVDAPDMYLIAQPQVLYRGPFTSGWEAKIDVARCGRCGRCVSVCRFHAIAKPERNDEAYKVLPMFCEGCGACAHACPRSAIELEEAECGEWMISETRFGTMLHADMRPGAENSGKLVTLLRNKAREVAAERGARFILCDGPPGVGCPVMATLTGAEHAVVVTEPSVSALHDLQRVVELASRFRVPVSLFLNKADLNDEISNNIREFAEARGVTWLGAAPYDPVFTAAQMDGKAVVEVGTGEAGRAIREAWAVLLTSVQTRNQRADPFRLLRVSESAQTNSEAPR